jgi:hypothetical protein
MIWRVLLALAAAVVAVAALGVAVAWASHLGEPSVPAAGALPTLPQDAVVVRRGDGCGSGSCYREVVLAPAPDETAAELLDRLDLEETCGPGSLLDRRRHCTGAYLLGHGEQVLVYASVEKSLA